LQLASHIDSSHPICSEYKKLTTAACENPQEIKDRESFVHSQWESLSGLSKAKREVLDAALALEIRKDKLRLSFANQAAGFLLWTKETADHANATQFGFTLEEVRLVHVFRPASISLTFVSRSSHSTSNPPTTLSLRAALSALTRTPRPSRRLLAWE
jgi:hypothetical protein